MDKKLQDIISEMKESGYTEDEALQWVIDDPENLFVQEFRDEAKQHQKTPVTDKMPWDKRES